VNAARVPRIFRREEGRAHHHVEIVIRLQDGAADANGGRDGEVEVREVLRGSA
jgi:hypothetical protein